MLGRETNQKGVRAQPIKEGARDVAGGPHPVTNHQSFAQGVLYDGANKYRAATADLLHGRSHRDPTMKPHEHSNLDPSWYLHRAAAMKRNA